MTYDFFAAKEDKIAILDFIFNETDLSVFDLSSPYGQAISQYTSVDEIANKFDLVNDWTTLFQLWSPRHKGEVLFRKVDLNPRYCDGYTFRYATQGWGVIQLYFGGAKGNQLNRSHIGHFNEKGAAKWEDSTHFNGPVAAWDWKEIKKTSDSLRRHIDRNLVERKIGTLGVLKGAHILSEEGIQLV
jgi:hypothetical protein